MGFANNHQALVVALLATMLTGLPASARAADVIALADPAIRASLGLALELELHALEHTLRWDAPAAGATPDARVSDAWARTVSTGADAAVVIETRGPIGGAAPAMVLRVVLPARPSGAITAAVSDERDDDGGRAVALVAATLVDDALRSESAQASVVVPAGETVRVEIVVRDERAPEPVSEPSPGAPDPLRFSLQLVPGLAYSPYHGYAAFAHHGGLALEYESLRVGLAASVHNIAGESSELIAAGMIELGGLWTLPQDWAAYAHVSAGYARRFDRGRDGVVGGLAFEVARDTRGPDPVLRAAVEGFLDDQGTLFAMMIVGAGIRFR